MTGRTKKPYQPPRLIVYGAIRRITQQNGNHTNKDGGSNAVFSRT